MTETPHRRARRPPFRYDARLANEIEAKWQDRWEPTTPSGRPTRPGRCATGSSRGRGPPKLYVLDMFPYPSGDGPPRRPPARLHRHRRVRPLHAHERPQRAPRHGLRRVRPPRRAVRGADRPAPTRHHRGEHRHHAPPAACARARPRPAPRRRHHRRPRTTGGRSGSSCRSSTPGTTRTPDRARPDRRAARRVRGRHACARERRQPRRAARGRELDAGDTRAHVVDSYRLAYLDEALVNWCPALGTVLANEEVTADGRSERGNHPVFRRPLKQWMLRITAYADRLLADLDLLDWPESIKTHAAQLDRPQRRRRRSCSRSRSTTASTSRCSRRVPTRCSAPRTWCSRPSTRWSTRSSRASGPTRPGGRPRRHARRVAGHLRPRRAAGGGGARRTASSPAQKSELERQAEGREKTGVFTGAFAINPTNGWNIPIFIADYVLMGYGTGAIMAVPAHDQRDFEFAQRVRPADRRRGAARPTAGCATAASTPTRPADEWPEAYIGDGVGHELGERRGVARRPAHARGEAAHHRVARGERDRRGGGHLQAARLAVQPPALLGRAVPDRLRRRRPPASRSRSRCCRSSCPR